MDLGDLATWFGVFFAAVAAGATIWTLKSQRDQIAEQRQFIAEQSANLALERAELHAVAEERKWAQARKIGMEIRKAGGEPDGAGGFIGYDHWVVTVRNSSEAPVHALKVRFGTSYVAVGAWELLPRSRQGRERRTVPMVLLGPGRAAEFHSQRGSRAMVDDNLPSLIFQDDDGARWRLYTNGDLEEDPAEPAS